MCKSHCIDVLDKLHSYSGQHWLTLRPEKLGGRGLTMTLDGKRILRQRAGSFEICTAFAYHVFIVLPHKSPLPCRAQKPWLSFLTSCLDSLQCMHGSCHPSFQAKSIMESQRAPLSVPSNSPRHNDLIALIINFLAPPWQISRSLW